MQWHIQEVCWDQAGDLEKYRFECSIRMEEKG